jgi:hypothetical protein
VSAGTPNREELVAAAHQDDVFAIYLSEGHRSIGKIANQETLPKIAFRFFRHVNARVSV